MLPVTKVASAQLARRTQNSQTQDRTLHTYLRPQICVAVELVGLNVDILLGSLPCSANFRSKVACGQLHHCQAVCSVARISDLNDGLHLPNHCWSNTAPNVEFALSRDSIHWNLISKKQSDVQQMSRSETIITKAIIGSAACLDKVRNVHYTLSMLNKYYHPKQQQLTNFESDLECPRCIQKMHSLKLCNHTASQMSWHSPTHKLIMMSAYVYTKLYTLF